ncbi:MAG: UDP-N-acetylglucosamine 2-epimerase (non-hydrolyzing) [Calditrichaeota bacterium]|nr:MAG: UDP-N-acetylglucosamine 2-epimerase (non-hydrolyzing) [Calditrichota bacterium]
MKRILNVVGARPNFMKIAPIHRQMKQFPDSFEPILVHTGQHYDEAMSKIFFEQLQLPEPDIYLGVGSGSHAEQTAKIMIAFEKVCMEHHPDLVLVVGDVNSTLACSLVASKLHIPVAHVEAGLRSGDVTMPEEINRIVTDRLSDYLFTTEESGNTNLKAEGIPEGKIFFVGNVMIDSLVHFLPQAESSHILEELNVTQGSYALVTLHRPSNVDEKEKARQVLEILNEVQQLLPVVFPIHPRTSKNFQRFGFTEMIAHMEQLKMIPPASYLDFLKLMKHARLVLTDSGGIQEETTYLGIPCLTLRENTERPITVHLGSNEIVGMNKSRIMEALNLILNNQWKNGEVPQLWDGKAAERIVKVLKEH